MDDVQLRSQLLALGRSDADLGRLTRSGDLQRIRRGAYGPAATEEWSVEDRHRQLIAATLPQLRREGVLSHGSAAVIHGLPVWSGAVAQVHLTRTRTGQVGGGRTRRHVALHAGCLDVGSTADVDGHCVTSLARTVIDLARTRPFEQAVAAADKALAAGLPPATLDAELEQAGGYPGVNRARKVVSFADARSESAGESVSRVRLALVDVPVPTLQYEVAGADGNLVGRTDFAWPEAGTLGEFDGRCKYGRLLRPGQDPAEVVYAEKLREDLLRDLGWQVVRWTWAEITGAVAVVVDRLRRAFARAR